MSRAIPARAASAAATLALLLLGVPATAAEMITGSAAVKALIGNTVSDAEGRGAMFFGRDGRWAALDGSKKVNGRWTEQSEKICVVEDGKTSRDCWTAVISGTDVVMTIEDMQLKVTLMPGNPRDL